MCVDAWALRTFANKFVLSLYFLLTLVEYAMFGHLAPWNMLIYPATVVVVSLHALQLAGILQT